MTMWEQNNLNSASQSFLFLPQATHPAHTQILFSMLLHELLQIFSFHLPPLKNYFITSSYSRECCRVPISKGACISLQQGEAVGLPFIPCASLCPVSNSNIAFSGINAHCAGQPCLLCPLVISSGDSTQSYRIKHTAEGKKESWKEKPRFSQAEGSNKHGKPFSWKMKMNETGLQYSGSADQELLLCQHPGPPNSNTCWPQSLLPLSPGPRSNTT